MGSRGRRQGRKWGFLHSKKSFSIPRFSASGSMKIKRTRKQTNKHKNQASKHTQDTLHTFTICKSRIKVVTKKLKLQYFGYLMQRTDWLEKTLMLGKIAGGEGDNRGGWMASPTRWTWVWASCGIWWWTRKPGVLQCMGSQRVKQDWATEVNWSVYTVHYLLLLSAYEGKF